MATIQRVSAIVLINSSTEAQVLTIQNGAVIDLAIYGKTLNIRAITIPGTVGSVVFNVTGRLVYNRIDNSAPYSLFGDTGGNYTDWTPSTGDYNVVATPWTMPNGTGRRGKLKNVTFTVIDTSTTPPNVAPTANAGVDKSITLPVNSTTLNGTGTDPDGTIISYSWAQISGPSTPTLVTNNTATVTVSNLQVGTYTYRLTVTDDDLATDTDDINVTVNPVIVPNNPPTANAGVNQTITLPTNSVNLSGSGADTDGTIVGYLWTQVSGPSTATLSTPTLATTTAGSLIAGTYTFRLRVTDDDGATATDDVSIVVNSSTPVNQLPIAEAGANKAITLPTNLISLSGSASIDPDGTIVTYRWTQVSGPSIATFSHPNSVATNVSNFVAGIYTFRLTVTDNLGATDTDDVVLTVNPSPTPANVTKARFFPRTGWNARMLLGVFQGSNTSSSTGYTTLNTITTTPAAGVWTEISLPATTSYRYLRYLSPNGGWGNVAEIEFYNGTTKLIGNGFGSPGSFEGAGNTFDKALDGNTTTFFDGATADGQYVGIDTGTPPTPNVAPTVNAGSDRTITLPTNSLTLTGAASDSDGTIMTYLWQQVSGPNTATLTNAGTISVTVSNLLQGIYVFRLTVTDDDGATNSDTVSVTVEPAIVEPPLGRVFYASPNGTGTGSSTSPFKISNFWPIAVAGDTLILLDGKYTGASSMIKPPAGLSGTSAKPITIKALNDGKVEIDGQVTNVTFEFSGNSYFIVEGINVHHPGTPGSINTSVVTLGNGSNNNILRRICAWEAQDGNTNVFGVHHSTNNLLEDCAGWGMGRKTFSNSQGGDYTTFRRCFGRWEGSHAEGPKKVFGLSYNSYNALAENCIATWDGLRMQQNYELHDYFNVGVGQFFTNYTVQQPDGLYSHDGFDQLPDVANIRIYGCIAYLKAGQRFHNSTKKHAGPYAFEIKGVDIKHSISYIEPGTNTDIFRLYLSSPTSTNIAANVTAIGGVAGTVDSGWTVSNLYTTGTCGTITANNKTVFDPNGITTGARVINRYVNGTLTTTPLWPWPMNQRIIDAMTLGGYTPIDVTRDIYQMCGGTVPSTQDIVQKAKSWLTSTGSARTALEADLAAWTSDLDGIISQVKPVPTATQKGEVFYQNFTNPTFQQRYPSHQYHMYVPSHYTPSTPFGLILWLHGGGSWDSTEIDHLAAFDMDNEQVTGRSYPRTETDTSNYILVAPIAPFGTTIPHPEHASRWDVPVSDQYLMDIITEVSTKYNINYNKVVIAGFSMGGIGAYHQAIRLNDRLSACMASAGSWKLGSWADLKYMPMYLIQGVTDAFFSSTSNCRNHFTAIEYARHAYTRLSAGSAIHVKNEYPGGHSWDSVAEAAWDAFINGQTGWVTTKVRDPYRPSTIARDRWRTYDVGSNFNITWNEDPSPHTMWITIKTSTGGTIAYDYAQVVGDGSCTSQTAFNNWSLNLTTMNLAGSRVEATITGPNQITVTTTNVTQFSLWLHPNMPNINLLSPIQVKVNGGAFVNYTATPNLLKALQSYERRWDWGMIYHAEITINV